MSSFEKVKDSPVYGTPVHDSNEDAHGTKQYANEVPSYHYVPGQNSSGTSTYQGKYGGEYKTSYKTCTHHDHKPGWKIQHESGEWTTVVGDKESETDMSINADASLIIDCSMGKPFAKSTSAVELIVPEGMEKFRDLNQYINASIPRLYVPWPDMTPPRIDPMFWPELISRLPSGKVMFCCTGGHGRTGTALACLRVVLWGETAAEAINSVRRDYCSEAIETAAQRAYIVKVAQVIGQKFKNIIDAPPSAEEPKKKKLTKKERREAEIQRAMFNMEMDDDDYVG